MCAAMRSTAIRGAGSMAGTRGGLHAAWTEDLGEQIEKGVSGAGGNGLEGPSAVPSGGSRTSGNSAENEIEGATGRNPQIWFNHCFAGLVFRAFPRDFLETLANFIVIKALQKDSGRIFGY